MTQSAQQQYTRAERKKMDEYRRLIAQLQQESQVQRIMVSSAIEDLKKFVMENSEDDQLLNKKKDKGGCLCFASMG